MRDIKFRGQVKGSYIVSTGLPEWHYFEINPGCVLDLDDIENICQYIGLKDAEGNEIYEGDKITMGHDEGEVYVMTVAFLVDRDHNGWEVHPRDIENGSVVVGNIHENPDLLD